MGGDDERAVAYLRTTRAIRERCEQVYALVRSGSSPSFVLHEARLADAAARVIAHIRANHPSPLKIPGHSRWRHFAYGGVNRHEALRWPADRDARARAELDLVIPSVLLDAGAGEAWRYREEGGSVVGRSEGLALASLHAFASGMFSADEDDPLRADAEALARIDAGALARAFQVREDNPLVGVEGRVELMRALGRAVPRPGVLYDRIVARADAQRNVPATEVLAVVLESLGSIWPGRIAIGGVSLGDTWRHPSVRGEGATDGLVPFHKLSQWLSYSLLDPLARAGVGVTELDGLTGLPEYRNGGLFVDAGVLEPAPELLGRTHGVGDEPIVEWRALTVALLDRIAERVRAGLGLDARLLPLARVLEGGTWAAGRSIAKEKRPDGSPPFRIASDGTVF
jgi:hypothetical protein